MRLVNMACYLLWKSGEPSTNDAMNGRRQVFAFESLSRMAAWVCGDGVVSQQIPRDRGVSLPSNARGSRLTPGTRPEASDAEKLIRAHDARRC